MFLDGFFEVLYLLFLLILGVSHVPVSSPALSPVSLPLVSPPPGGQEWGWVEGEGFGGIGGRGDPVGA